MRAVRWAQGGLIGLLLAHMDVVLQDGETIPGTGPPELIFSTGDKEALKGKAVYFVRVGDKVDTDKVCDWLGVGDGPRNGEGRHMFMS